MCATAAAAPSQPCGRAEVWGAGAHTPLLAFLMPVQNVLLVRTKGRPAVMKICDFGYAKTVDDSAPKTRAGTLHYVAPGVRVRVRMSEGELWGRNPTCSGSLPGSRGHRCRRLHPMPASHLMPCHSRRGAANGPGAAVQRLCRRCVVVRRAAVHHAVCVGARSAGPWQAVRAAPGRG